MRFIKLIVLVLGLMISVQARAQQTLPKEEKTTGKKKKSPVKKEGRSSNISVKLGLGVANYFGDLMQYNRFFSQPGFAFSAGAAYEFTPKFNAGINLGVQQVKAADSKNKGAQYKARNLSFKSNVFDVSISGEYILLNMKKYGFSPYISAGVGIMFFNPYANDPSGKKQNLRELGTEGQGLSAYPNRKIYSKSAVEFPLGFGLKFDAGKNVMLQVDFSYRFTSTDYLDDVSSNSYPDKVVLDARNPTTAKFTWRGNEVGGEPYPKNLSLPRGNPNDKDGYYTTQFKVSYKL